MLIGLHFTNHASIECSGHLRGHFNSIHLLLSNRCLHNCVQLSFFISYPTRFPSFKHPSQSDFDFVPVLCMWGILLPHKNIRCPSIHFLPLISTWLSGLSKGAQMSLPWAMSSSHPGGSPRDSQARFGIWSLPTHSILLLVWGKGLWNQMCLVKLLQPKKEAPQCMQILVQL